MKRFIPLFLLLICLTASGNVYPQACCTAGTPLLSSLQLPATEKGIWQFVFTYDQNELKDNYLGNSSFDIVNSRKRNTRSVMFEAGYGLTGKFSLSALGSYVIQERRTADLVRTRGPGDLIILLKYTIIPLSISGQRSFAVGAGPKIPLGKDRIEHQGIILNEDIQPGSGTWDTVLWGYFQQGFLPVTRLNSFFNLSYRIPTENWRGFKFGNELTLTAGTTYGTDIFFRPSMMIRYRYSSSFRVNNSTVPNTGGHWLNLILGLNIKLNESLSTSISGHLPIYRDLNGLQLTTSYKVTLSIFYNLKSSASQGLIDLK